MRVPAIHITLAPRAGVELAALQREPLEVENDLPGERAIAAVQKEVGLREVRFGEVAPVVRRRGMSENADRLCADGQKIRSLLHVMRLPRDRSSTSEQQQEGEQNQEQTRWRCR